MNKIIFGGMFLLGVSIYSYAGLAEPIVEKVADILIAKINADKDVAIEALKNASTITIDGEIYHHITIGERVVIISNSGGILLGDVNIGSITNIVDIKKDAVVLNSSDGLLVMGYDSENNRTIEKEK